jgi:hypothetical protein
MPKQYLRRGRRRLCCVNVKLTMGLAREARLIVSLALYYLAGFAPGCRRGGITGGVKQSLVVARRGWRVLHILGAERPARTGRAFSGPSLFVFIEVFRFFGLAPISPLVCLAPRSAPRLRNPRAGSPPRPLLTGPMLGDFFCIKQTATERSDRRSSVSDVLLVPLPAYAGKHRGPGSSGSIDTAQTATVGRVPWQLCIWQRVGCYPNPP